MPSASWLTPGGIPAAIVLDQTSGMFVVRGTKKFLDRVSGQLATDADNSTNALADWFANVWFWRPHVALFVNTQTLFPVIVPLAPTATVVARFGDAFSLALTTLDIDSSFTRQELAAMSSYGLAKTNSRSILGTMNDFMYMADSYRGREGSNDLLAMSLWLAHTPCRVHSRDTVFPDLELAAIAGRTQ